jgi:hypothetical protein
MFLVSDLGSTELIKSDKGEDGVGTREVELYLYIKDIAPTPTIPRIGSLV